ncbi:alpha-1A adrenergic receptor-like isoform X1 [Oratosquilla oratoria]|uniref:alpha-1A adrenergic receptor-like isoform X1 n=1 Tax=Oratosquilla oratoria TaxID=337810 RepID=UPI003F75E898
MIETVVGNFLVILSVKVEKKLQTPFNYYIVNLAFTDMNVGMSVMSLFLIYNLYEYFPFNDYLCNYWIWSDYTMTFESVMTLAAISIDRFWSVTWTLHYRNHNSGRKSLYIILMTWVIVSCIWLPAFIYDRIVHDYAPGDCFWDSEKNKKLVLYVGFLGYYSPLFIMLGAYTRIFYVMKKRAAQVKAQTKRSEVTAASNPAETSEGQSSAEGGGAADQKKLVQPTAQKTKKDDIQDAKLRREQKAVYTLLNIVVIFLICWIPFYILFVISAWFPTFFPSWYINFSYWMAYINSAVNPVLYPLSSAEFRSAYKKIFKMAMCQK